MIPQLHDCTHLCHTKFARQKSQIRQIIFGPGTGPQTLLIFLLLLLLLLLLGADASLKNPKAPSIRIRSP